MNNFRHLLRYGTNAEQKYFTDDLANFYDGIIINANMAAFSPDAMAIFIVKKTTVKPFIIDPITHAFQHDQSFISNISETKKKIIIKKSISNLINSYGEELRDIVSESSSDVLTPKKQLNVSDINSGFIESFTENVLNFQRNISLSRKVEDYREYLIFSPDGQSSDIELNLKPMFLVAPYFYISNDELGWVDKNIQFIQKSKEKLLADESLLAQITVSHELIEMANGDYANSDLKKFVINEYKRQNNVSGYLIWINGFVEHEESIENITVYLDMIADLRTSGEVKIYSLYGSYLSEILTNPGLNLLDGVCHGLEYGESREVIPVGGGLPVPKFYFYPIHKRVGFFEMFRFLSSLKIESREKYLKEICDCNTCKSLISSKDIVSDFKIGFGEVKKSTFQVNGRLVSREFATSQTKDRSLRHYLESKKKEFDFVESKNPNDIINQLDESYEKYKNSFGANGAEHLSRWSNVLNAFLKK